MKIYNRQTGVTLVELLIAMAILAILVVSVAPMFNISQQGYSAMEARNSLKTAGQTAINKVGHRLSETKRLFENEANSLAFLARVQLTTPPNALTGSVLPKIEETGSISPSTTAFVAGSVGNSLFFVSSLAPKDQIVSVGSSTEGIRVDMYRFNYYFLAENSGKSVGGQSSLNLWEWQSIPYADYTQLFSILNSTKQINTVQNLRTGGTLYAWDPTAATVTAAFYDLNANGTMSLNASHNIPEGLAKPMLRILTGVMGGGYRYGVSPNTGSGFSPFHSVPAFGTVSGRFPSGFEVVVVGPSSLRQVFMRLVLGAEGSFKGDLSSEQVLLSTVRDIW